MGEINPYRIFVGPLIPNWLLKSKKISPTAKLVYARMCQFAGKDGRCFPGQEKIAKEIGCGDRNVRKAITELKKIELIKSVRRGLNKTNIYVFLDHEMIWNEEEEEEEKKEEEMVPDRNNRSGQERNNRSGQERNNRSYKENQSEENQSEVDSGYEIKKSHTRVSADGNPIKSKSKSRKKRRSPIHPVNKNESASIPVTKNEFTPATKNASASIPANRSTSTTISIPATKNASASIPANNKKPANGFNPKKNSAPAGKKISAARRKYIEYTKELTELWNLSADYINSEFAPPKKLTQHQFHGKAFDKRVKLIRDAMEGRLQNRMSKNGWFGKLDEEKQQQLLKLKLNKTRLEWLITDKWRFFFNPDKNKSNFRPEKYPTNFNDFLLNHSGTSWAFLLYDLSLNGNGKNPSYKASQSTGDEYLDLISENLESALTVDVGAAHKRHLNDIAKRLYIWFEECCDGQPRNPQREEQIIKRETASIEIPYPEAKEFYEQVLREDGNTKRYFKVLKKDSELKRKVIANREAMEHPIFADARWRAIGWFHECKTVNLAEDYAGFVKHVAEENGYTVSPRAVDIGSNFFYMYITNRLAPLFNAEQYPFPFDPEKVTNQVERARSTPWEN